MLALFVMKLKRRKRPGETKAEREVRLRKRRETDGACRNGDRGR